MLQLKMEKDDLANVPAIAVPEGYVLRTFRDGDEAALGRIYAASDLGMTTAEQVRANLVGKPCFKPERVFVVEYHGEPVGTASAWWEGNDPEVGYLHMVGLLPDHRGKQLGALLTVAAIGYTRNEGFTAQRLDTDDWRLPAIRLYLDLGYYPLYLDDTHPDRWAALTGKLGRPEALERARDRRSPASAP